MPQSKPGVVGLDSDDNDHGDWSFLHRLRDITKPDIRVIGLYCPLVASILAPLATLLDIPALTQRWYTLNGVEQPDPKASLILSALGLFFNVVANLTLLFRFSTKTQKWTNIATRVSLISWLFKLVLAAVNLIVFGMLTRNAAGYSYQEGFWCAVVSIIDSGVICIALLVHYFAAFGHREPEDPDIRMQGRQFMLSVTVFLGILAIQALVFCKIQGWTYLNSIYFSVQTALTIGYGDYVPTYTSTKILVFIFSVLTISQLGNEIAIIIAFFSARATKRRDKWRHKYEGAMHRAANEKRPNASLIEEMALIHAINAKEEMMSQMYDLMWSAIALVLFWTLGALMFSQMEGWTYGNGLYAVMILSLTIGFGDYTPTTPAARVVFIVYALAAVPIVTSFAVQTITGLLSTYSERQAKRDRYRRARRNTPEVFRPHAEYVVRAHESYRDMRDRLVGRSSESDDAESSQDGQTAAGTNTKDMKEELNTAERRVLQEHKSVERIEQASSTDDGSSETGVRSEKRDLELDLVKHLMELTVKLEAEARELLLNSMENGIARTVLLADRNVQIRDVKAVRGDDANMLSIWRGVDKQNQQADESGGQLAKVRRYRSTFAEILVIGSILQRLEGKEQLRFERWQTDEVDSAMEERRERERQLDLEKIADQQFDGISSRILRHHGKILSNWTREIGSKLPSSKNGS